MWILFNPKLVCSIKTTLLKSYAWLFIYHRTLLNIGYTLFNMWPTVERLYILLKPNNELVKSKWKKVCIDFIFRLFTFQKIIHKKTFASNKKNLAPITLKNSTFCVRSLIVFADIVENDLMSKYSRIIACEWLMQVIENIVCNYMCDMFYRILIIIIDILCSLIMFTDTARSKK